MRIKNLPSIESMDGSQDALVIEQTDGSEDKSRKVSPAQIKQYVLNDMDDVPTADSNNPVKSGGIFSTMGVPKIDTATGKMYLAGGAAFGGNIDSSPTAGSNNAVASGGTKTYVDNAVSSNRSTTNNITISRMGKVRVLSFNRAVYSDIKTFFANLDSSDKPNTIQFSTVMRNSPDNKYMTLAFLYASATGGLYIRHFAQYNANTEEGEIGTTDRVLGEIVYIVD